MEPLSKLHHVLVGGRASTVLLTASPGTALILIWVLGHGAVQAVPGKFPLMLPSSCFSPRMMGYPSTLQEQ